MIFSSALSARNEWETQIWKFVKVFSKKCVELSLMQVEKKSIVTNVAKMITTERKWQAKKGSLQRLFFWKDAITTANNIQIMVFTLWQTIKAPSTNPGQRTRQKMIVINRHEMMLYRGLLPWIIIAQTCGPTNTAKDISPPMLVNSLLFLMYFRTQGTKGSTDLLQCLDSFTGEWMLLENVNARWVPRGEVLEPNFPCSRGSWGKLPGCS